MIRDTSKLKERLRENMRIQNRIVDEVIKKGHKGGAMYAAGHHLGLDNALRLIELWEKEETV